MPRFIDIDGSVSSEAAADARAAIGFDAAAYDAAVSALATDESVSEAAVVAVEAAADSLNLVVSTDPRLPEVGEPDVFRIRDITGASAIEVSADGETKIGDTIMRAEGPYYSGLRIMDSEDKLALDVRPDGTVFVGQFSEDSSSFDAVQTTKVHVLIAMGQSNMAGRAEPFGGDLDPVDSRIWQLASGDTEITAATVPLGMPDGSPYMGLSPITVIAREYVKRLPPGELVLIIPAAKGASILGEVDTEAINGVWVPGYVGESLDLYGNAITQIETALRVAAVKWPTADIAVTAMFWHQGEGNASNSTAIYEERFDALVSDLRSQLSDPDLPVVLGGMSPEYVAATPGLERIVAAHTNTPSRVLRTAFAPGPVDGGHRLGDQVHFHRGGVIELGRRMLLAWDRALINVLNEEQHAPMSVTAQLVGGELTVKWDFPPCRYTGFVVEYDEGSGWTAITHTDVSTTATASGLTAPVQVRVSTINEEGTSYTTTPVYADYKG